MGLTPYIVAFAAGLGALIGGGYGAILAATVATGIVLVIGLIGAVSLVKQQQAAQAAQAELADLVGENPGAEWSGLPDHVVDPQSGIAIPRKPDDA